MSRDLSILIPARNERWLPNTVSDVLAHIKADTEIIVVLDGAWPTVPLPQHERLTVVFVPESIGQRAATNLAARLSTARYLMKLDGHCGVAPGFDAELIRTAEELGPDVTQIPAQRNLHLYDHVCDTCHFRADQAPHLTECPQCKGPLRQEVVWQTRTTTTNWVLNADLRFTYASGKQQSGDICDVMTSLGACFFMSRDRFWELDGLDEKHGSWGAYGAEIALKSWTSGGRHVVNRRTWFSHFFRVGGIGFPYPIAGSDQERARQYSRDLWFNNRWPKQVHPLSWVVEKFWPVEGWTDEDRAKLNRSAGIKTSKTPKTKGLVYYSDCLPEPRILEACREQLRAASTGLPLVSVTLQPVPGFGTNLHLPLERGYLTMFEQIRTGLEVLDTDVAFLVEHDVLYSASHFAHTPHDANAYHYNQNTWKVSAETGQALHYLCNQTSGLCADRQLLVNHYRARVAAVRAHGFTRRNGFEPGTRQVRNGGFDDYGHVTWMSDVPNIDIRHGANLTATRWRREQFRNQKYTAGWTEGESVPGWPGPTFGRFDAFLAGIGSAQTVAA